MNFGSVEQILKRSPVLVLDVETDGLDWKRNQSIGYVLTWGPGPDDTTYLPFRHVGGNGPDPRPMFRKLLAPRTDLRLVFFNAAFDLGFFWRDGIDFAAVLEDAQINQFLLDERLGAYSLEACCRVAQVQAKKGDQLYQHIAAKFGGEPTRAQMGNFHLLAGDDPVAVDYATGDGTSTWQLWEKQQAGLDEQDLRRIWDIESRLIRVLHRMVRRGVLIDEERLDQVRRMVKGQYDAAMRRLPKGLNVRGPKGLKELFTKTGNVDWPTTPAGNASFPEEWLSTFPAGRDIVLARQLRNLEDSFFAPLADRHLFDGRVHTTFNQTRGEEFGTVTGRLSSTDPNMQQVHKRNELLGSLFRSVVIPDEGMVWGSADYSQCEPKLLAYYGNVRVLLDGYRSDPPVDAHTAVARAAGIDRESGKRLNQALITGAGDRKAGMMLRRSPEETRQILYNYFKAMPEIKGDPDDPRSKGIQQKSADVMLYRGYVRSLLGRRARLEDPRFAYKALNRLLQCGNADVIKLSMVRIDEYLREQGDQMHMLLSIHDDLAFQFPESYRGQYKHCLTLMEDYGPGRHVELPLVLSVDVKEGASWAEATYGIDKVRANFKKMGGDYDRRTVARSRTAA